MLWNPVAEVQPSLREDNTSSTIHSRSCSQFHLASVCVSALLLPSRPASSPPVFCFSISLVNRALMCHVELSSTLTLHFPTAKQFNLCIPI